MSSLRSTCSSLLSTLRPAFPPIPTGPSGSRWASSYVQLHDLMPNPGSSRNNVRLGRGSSSTKGGTSGRGHKGQKARSGNGKPKAGFEGGQTPITRLFPKRGFVNFAAKEFLPLNIAQLQSWLAMGRLDAAQPIDVGAIYQARLAKGVQRWDGIKLLGDIDPLLPLPPLTLRLSRYSKQAARAILDAGGSLTAVYQNKLALRQAAHPEKFEGRGVKEALPTQKRDIEFYSDPKNFGYLAKEAGAGAEQARAD